MDMIYRTTNNQPSIDDMIYRTTGHSVDDVIYKTDSQPSLDDVVYRATSILAWSIEQPEHWCGLQSNLYASVVYKATGTLM